MAQLALLDEPATEVQWLEVTKKPTVNWLHDHSSRAYGALCELSEKELIKTWKAVGIANYLWRRGIEPKGYVWRRHKHLMHQMGSETLINKVQKEFETRGLHLRFGLDICIQ